MIYTPLVQILAFLAVCFKIREIFTHIIIIITIINDYCRENLYPQKFRIKEDFSNSRNIESSKTFTRMVGECDHKK